MAVFTLTIHLSYLLALGAVIRIMQLYNYVRRIPVLTILPPGAPWMQTYTRRSAFYFFHQVFELPSWGSISFL